MSTQIKGDSEIHGIVKKKLDISYILHTYQPTPLANLPD